ncbi:MAG: N-6 DNA methylase [Firmicutes bacterium]|nr:N-6 DNA methylase [Bacillota bacterium]
MVNKLNVEMFYDYFDEIANLLYNSYQKSYLEGMNEAFNFLLDDQFEGEYSLEDNALFIEIKSRISEISFDREEIRKSVQLGILKGYKHASIPNSMITPDTIGLFMGYLIEKLYQNQTLNSIFDPLIGSGNLVYTILNYLQKSLKVYGVDHDLLKCKLARNTGDLLDIDNEIFYQDSLTYYDQGFDLVVTDMPLKADEANYFPYMVLNHHAECLVEGGFLLALIDNDFFEQKDNEIFKQEISTKCHIFGLIKLSETLFKLNPKSILILQKKGSKIEVPKKFLLVDLPSFNDVEDFNNTINIIDKWFEERKGDIL